MFFLLFLLALYEFYKMGLTGYAAVCMAPVIVLIFYVALKFPMGLFGFLFFANYFVMGSMRYFSLPIPVTVIIELPQILLLMVILITSSTRPQDFSPKYGTPMLLAIGIWTTFLILQVFNQTCQLPVSYSSWLLNVNNYLL